MTKILNELPHTAVEGQVVALDIEMFKQNVDKLHRPHGVFACISIKYKDDDNVYQLYDKEQLPELFHRLRYADWTLHNALYDLRQLRALDTSGFLNTDRPIYDTMLVEQNLFGGLYRDFGLNHCVRRYLDIYMEKETREEFESAEVMTDQMKEYAALDVVYTLLVREAQEKLGRNMKTYWEVDAPMIWVLMDILPVKVDVEGWKKMVEGFAEKAKELEADLGFNAKSVPQTKKALLAEGINVESTGAKILEAYEKKSPLVRKLLDTRKYRDVSSKYGLKWLENAVEEDDLVWANFKINGAETGRMACSNPNLQNIPRKDFPEYREMFISRNGTMLAPDVSQQEPRVLGYLTQDKNLLEALSSGESIHVYVARMIYDDPTIVKDGADYRYGVGKAINLAIGYGLTADGLAAQTGLTSQEAQVVIDKYFKRFPGVQYYMFKYRNMAYRHGYVETVAGRRVYVNPYDFQSENNAINAPIQGGAADFTKVWAINVRKLSKERGIPLSLCMLVHDELVFDVHNEYLDATKQVISDAMQIAGEIYPGIPFISEVNQGESWACHV